MKARMVGLSIVILSIAVHAFAFDTLEHVRPRVYAFAVPVEQDAAYVTLTNAPNGSTLRTVMKSSSTVSSDGSFVVEQSDEHEYAQMEFKDNGLLMSSRQENKDNGMVLTIEVAQDRKKVTFRVAEKGKEAAQKTADLKPANMLNPELRFLISQAWTAGIRGGLSVKGFSPDGSREADMDIRLTETADPLSASDKYAYPAEFKAFFSKSQKYVVGDMYLTGIASLFYGHHNFFAFEETPQGLEFVAYWGGDPKTAVFQYREEMKPQEAP